MKKFAIIDIETSSLKVLIASLGRTIEIEDFFEESIPREIRSLEDKKIYIREKISDCLDLSLPVQNIIILAKGTDIVIRNYSFPAASKAQLQEAVKWKIIEHSHLNENDVVFKYRINKNPGYRYNTRINVTAAASSQSVIKKYHDYFLFTQYKTPSISFEAEGIRGFTLIEEGPAIEKKTVAVMYIGHYLTNIVILQKGYLTASRIIPTADENFSRVLVGETIVDGKTVTVSPAEAEIIKKDVGIPMGKMETSAYAKILPPSTITQMLQPLLEGFISEIERFFKFYKTESGIEKIDEILLAGPGTSLKNIDTYFENKFAIPTRVICASLKKLFSLKMKDPARQTAFQQNIKSFSPHLGLLASLRKETKILKIYESPTLIGKSLSTLKNLYTLLIAVIFLLSFFVLLSQSISLRNEATVLEKEWTDLMKTYHSFFVLQGRRANLNQTLTSFNEMKRSSQRPWLDIFREISYLAPKKLVLRTCRIHNQITPQNQEDLMLSMKGFVFDVEDNQEEIITEFILALNQSKFFRNVDITFTEKDIMENHLTHFEILAQIMDKAEDSQ